MRIKDAGKLSPRERLNYWVRERHQVYLRKLAGKPRPWTDDEVLQRYWFTNPYREHDKVTQWFRQVIRDPWRDDPKVLFATIAFRWFTRPETGEVLLRHDLLDSWDSDLAKRVITELSQAGQAVFTGAFVTGGVAGKTKIEYVCDDLITPAWEACGPGGWVREEMLRGAYERKSSMQGVQELFETLPGFGGHGFRAYECVCDLRYTMYLREAADKCSWSNPGPGAKRGLNRVMGRPVGGPCPDYQQRSKELLSYLQRMNPKMPAFEMREVEHSLCEWDKWERARTGDTTMKMKRVYDGGP